MKSVSFFLSLFFFFTFPASAQDPERFRNDIDLLTQTVLPPDSADSLILFTGSSTFTLWKNVQEDFPDRLVLNTAFGGSQYSDLLFWYDRVIRPFKPATIVIYEGDNDLAEGEMPDSVTSEAIRLVNRLKSDFPLIRIVILSPKPSPSRWDMHDRYETFIRLMKTRLPAEVLFIPVWTGFLSADGTPRRELYLEDNLHLSRRGYEILIGKLKPVL